MKNNMENNINKILIIGANGFLGRNLIRKLFACGIYQIFSADVNIEGLDKKYSPIEIDITNEENVISVIDEIKPDLCILTAAMTNVDACEDQKELAEKINSFGPLYLSKALKAIDGKIIHISTDFIFDGKSGDYKEEDEPNPISMYGKTKLKGELNIKSVGLPYIICRTSVIYGWPDEGQRENFFSWAYKALKKNSPLKIIDGQITTPTLVDDLAECIVGLLNFTSSGIYHTTGPEALSRYEFVKKIAKVFNYEKDLITPVEFFAQKAARPENSSLNTNKIQKLNIYQFRNVEESYSYLKNSKRI